MKVLRPELATDPINVKRFQQELKTTSLMTHPNVVPIYDSGITGDGTPYFVMEFLDGYTLEQKPILASGIKMGRSSLTAFGMLG